jgi:prefoldin subunit 5
VSIGVIVVGQPVFNRVVSGIDDNISTLNSTMDTVSQTLQLAEMTSSQVMTGMQTAETSVLDTARTISETRPLVIASGGIITGDIANSIDSVQAAIPTLAQLAGNVDQALTLLSKAQVLGIGLGINYNPDAPLAASITAVGNSFNGLPAKLRNMDGPITAVDRSMGTMATNLTEIAANLHDINASFTQLTDLFTSYHDSMRVAQQRLKATKTELHDDLQIIKMGALVFCIWLCLTQLAPLCVGIQMLFGR